MARGELKGELVQVEDSAALIEGYEEAAAAAAAALMLATRASDASDPWWRVPAVPLWYRPDPSDKMKTNIYNKNEVNE